VTTIVVSLGHEVIARSIEVTEVAAVTSRERPAFHQNPFRTLDQGAPAERTLEVLELGEAAQYDCERILQLVGLGTRDIREDTALGRLQRRIGQGKTHREAMRSLKRHVSRRLYRRLITTHLTP
jgi:hypothetical protein